MLSITGVIMAYVMVLVSVSATRRLSGRIARSVTVPLTITRTIQIINESVVAMDGALWNIQFLAVFVSGDIEGLIAGPQCA